MQWCWTAVLTAVQLVWLNPVEERAVLWDTSVDASIPGSSGMRKLTERALAETVPEEVAEHFKQRLEADPRIVHHIGLSPEDLPLLVEHNPSLAIAALLCLMPSSRIGECVPSSSPLRRCCARAANAPLTPRTGTLRRWSTCR